jgi:hypothetical protein
VNLPSCLRQSGHSNRSTQRGSAVLIVLALLACMSILMAANSDLLATLKQELRLLDQHQMKKYGPGAGD